MRKYLVYTALTTILLVGLFANKAWIYGSIPSRTIPATNDIYVSMLNDKNYEVLAEKLNELKITNNYITIAWIPLTNFNYININEKSIHYKGTSFLSRTGLYIDYPGFNSFGYNASNLKDLYLQGSYDMLCNAFRRANINYILMANRMDDIGLYSYHSEGDLLHFENFSQIITKRLVMKNVFSGYDLYSVKDDISDGQLVQIPKGELNNYIQAGCSHYPSSVRTIDTHIDINNKIVFTVPEVDSGYIYLLKVRVVPNVDVIKINGISKKVEIIDGYISISSGVVKGENVVELYPSNHIFTLFVSMPIILVSMMLLFLRGKSVG